MSTSNTSNKKNECYYEYILGQYCTQLNTAQPICIIHSLSYLVNTTFSGAKISREQIFEDISCRGILSSALQVQTC